MAKSQNTFQDVLFKPSVIRHFREGGTKVSNVTLAGTSTDEDSSNSDPTGSFRYDPPGAALKSTQQLNVDFSQFENHTFFNSAEMKVQTALDRIINRYPFDGTKAEYQQFIDTLSGFEKHVLDQFPKHRGYLNFKGGTANNYISVSTLKGANQLSAGMAGPGQYALNLSSSPFTVEMQLFVPTEANDNNVILQMMASGSTTGNLTKGLTMVMSASTDTTRGNVMTLLSSGSTFISASVEINKGQFQHIASVYDRNVSGRILMYVDGVLKSSSSVGVFGALGLESAPLIIGSGSTQSMGALYELTPRAQLSGSIDELRIFESTRTRAQLKTFAKRAIFPPPDGSLKLYYKFNEPSGSFSVTQNQDLVLDYSGNGLHSHVIMGSGAAFDMSLRDISAVSVPLTAESEERSPILFPSYASVVTTGSNLLTSASQYDFNNPNLITKLIPKHYLLEGQQFEGLLNENGNISENYAFSSDLPGGGKMQSAQIIASMLYLWSETFDEIKMFVDEFGRALKVDYLSDKTISDQLLPSLAKYYGVNLPNAYANASMSQFFEGDNLGVSEMAAKQSLQKIQNTMWRRVLTDLPELLRTRGTRNSIESMFRSLGINPNGSFRIKEYGGSRTRKIGDAYEKRVKIGAMIDFSGSLNSQGTIGGSGKDTNRPLIQSYYLSGSRVEPGIPYPAGNDGRHVSPTTGTNNPNDGLFTSGSWSVEGMFKLAGNTSHPVTQSLMRLQTTGSQFSGASNNWLTFNALAFGPVIGRSTGSLVLYGRPAGGSTTSMMTLTLSGVNIFDGKKWHVAFGRCRNDQTGSYVSSSYFLRAGQMGASEIKQFYEVNEYFNDSGNNTLNTISGSINASGSFIAIGSQSLSYDSSLSGGGFLNSVSEQAARNVVYTGRASGIRFFSKKLTQKETLQHIRNFESVGVEDPSLNFSFNTTASGSFERLRLDLSCNQPITKSDSGGNISIFDFSQNLLHASGTGFVESGAAKEVIKPERFDYAVLSPQFEMGSEPNKVRVRSYQSAENVRKAPSGVSFVPLYSIPENDQPKDDRRLSIELSSVQALNDDIINIFATLDYLDNAIGDPELVFAQEYRSLRYLRSIYFNRLTEKMSLIKFFDFFKWFDSIVGDLIDDLIPSTTRYLGTNFIVESHMLERPKFTYKYSDMYVGVLDRREASVIFLQQFLGQIRKF